MPSFSFFRIFFPFFPFLTFCNHNQCWPPSGGGGGRWKTCRMHRPSTAFQKVLNAISIAAARLGSNHHWATEPLSHRSNDPTIHRPTMPPPVATTIASVHLSKPKTKATKKGQNKKKSKKTTARTTTRLSGQGRKVDAGGGAAPKNPTTFNFNTFQHKTPAQWARSAISLSDTWPKECTLEAPPYGLSLLQTQNWKPNEKQVRARLPARPSRFEPVRWLRHSGEEGSTGRGSGQPLAEAVSRGSQPSQSIAGGRSVETFSVRQKTRENREKPRKNFTDCCIFLLTFFFAVCRYIRVSVE